MQFVDHSMEGIEEKLNSKSDVEEQVCQQQPQSTNEKRYFVSSDTVTIEGRQVKMKITVEDARMESTFDINLTIPITYNAIYGQPIITSESESTDVHVEIRNQQPEVLLNVTSFSEDSQFIHGYGSLFAMSSLNKMASPHELRPQKKIRNSSETCCIVS